MATPTYEGAGQPAANSGWLSGVGSWLGASAPSYATAPPAKAAAVVATPTPATAVVTSCEPDRITLVIPRERIDSQQLAASASDDGDVPPDDAERITLVIPRSLIQSLIQSQQ